MSRGSVSGLPSSSFFSGLYRNGLRARQPPALMPTAIMTRLARALAAKNLQSREIKPMIDKPAAMAARAARSTLGSAIARPNQRQMTRCVHRQRTSPRCCRPAGSGRFSWLRGRDLYHPRRLLLGRQAPLRGKLINQVRQMLTQASEQIVHAQAGLLAQRIERIAAERIRQILGRDVLIRAGADPGLRDAAMSAVLQFFYDVPEAAAQHAARPSAAEHTAQSAGEEVTQAATGLGAGACATRHAARLAAEQSAKDIVEPTARTAGLHSGAWR